MKSMAKYNRKLGAASVKKLFLIKCRKNKVFPKYLNNFLRTNSLVHTTNPRYRFKLDKIISSTKQKMLNLDIKTSFSDISYYKKIIVTLETQARECIPLEYINEFKMRQKKFYMNYVKTEGARLDNKLSRLLAEQKIQGWDYSNSTKDRRDWIVNLTDKVISDDILNVVCLGPVFSLPSRGNNSDIITLLADVESYLDTVKESDVRSWIRVSISNIVTNFINKKWVKGVQETEEMRMIRKGMAECKKFLNENKEIILLNSDKGNKSVIMERAEYRDKMSDLLKDNATYRILKGDPTMKIQRKSNGHIKDLVDLGIITKERGIFLKTHNGLAPKIYGLPKIHKEGVPLRPIVSCLGSPTYHLAKYMARIINCLRSNNMYSVKDSYTFKDRVVEQQVPPGYILISLDVKSLFTSIPTDWITEELRKKLETYQNLY